MHPTYSSFYMGLAGVIIAVLSIPFGMTSLLEIKLLPFIYLSFVGIFSMLQMISMSAAYVISSVKTMAPLTYTSLLFNYIIDLTFF